MFKQNDNGYKLIGAKSSEVVGILPAALYNLKVKSSFFGKEFNFEEVNRYKNARQPEGGVFRSAYAYVNRFFDPVYRKTREEMGMVNKLNVIFNGLPGTGKTHLACVLAEKLVKEKDAIGVVMNDIDEINFPEFIDNIRINDPDRLIVLILDEMEKNPHRCLKDPKFLAFLDGAESKENVIIIGTSNKISDLPDYLMDRPGRFEMKWDFKFTDVEVLRDTVRSIIPEDLADNKEFVDKLASEAHKDGVNTVDKLRFHVLPEVYAARQTEAGGEVISIPSIPKAVEEKQLEGEDAKEAVKETRTAEIMEDLQEKFGLPEDLARKVAESQLE